LHLCSSEELFDNWETDKSAVGGVDGTCGYHIDHWVWTRDTPLKEVGEGCEKKSECKSNKCKKGVCKKKKTKKENGKTCNKDSKCISNKCYRSKCRPSTCLDKKVICEENSDCCSLKCSTTRGTCNKGL